MNGHSALVGQTRYSPDGSTLYAAINGQNTVDALDPNTGAIDHTWNVGIAPRELTFVGDKLYVSNEGGRQAQPGDTTMGSYGTQVPVNGVPRHLDDRNRQRHRSREPVGGGRIHRRRPAPDRDVYQSGNALFVANTNSDTVSVIDTREDQVVQTIETKPWPSSAVGYEPDGIDSDQGRPPAGHFGKGQCGRGLPLRRHAEGPGELHRLAADGLLPGERGDRRQPDRRHEYPRHRRARPGHHDL